MDKHAGGPVWDEYAEENKQIEKIERELIRRGLPLLPVRMEASPQAIDAGEAKQPKSVVAKPRPLPQKKSDLSKYFDGLTAAQREAASLKFEYGLSTVAIARRLGIHRKSVDERIAAAERKMNAAQGREQQAKIRAQQNPGTIH